MKYRILESRPSKFRPQFLHEGWFRKTWKNYWTASGWGEYILEYSRLEDAELFLKQQIELDNHQQKVIKEF
jgi:hypothetical protein